MLLVLEIKKNKLLLLANDIMSGQCDRYQCFDYVDSGVTATITTTTTIST